MDGAVTIYCAQCGAPNRVPPSIALRQRYHTGVSVVAAPLGIAGRQLERARLKLEHAMDLAQVSALAAMADGAPEAQVARELGVDRMTVRKWAGKR